MAARESDVSDGVVDVRGRGLHPYFKFLKTVHKLETVDSFVDTPAARHLQTLLDTGQTVEYEKQKELYEQNGLQFRLTDMVLYETQPAQGRHIDVKIALQVKAHSITWYFWVPGGKDQYPQAFRDVLYKSAGEAHQKTERGCDLYYRGSNAFHVKTMHTKEQEAAHNHNHYRMKDNQPVLPKDFAEHMLAMKETQAFRDGFFEEGEIEAIIEDFNKHHRMWTYKGADGSYPSPEEEYMARPQNKINAADVLEFKMFGEQQEPCRISVTELNMDFNRARALIEERFRSNEGGAATSDESSDAAMRLEIAKLVKQFNALMDFRKIGGSRGLGSERAMTRQIEGSSLPEISVIAAKDDSIGETPPIPEWAIHALKEVDKAKRSIEEIAYKPKRESQYSIQHRMFKPSFSVSQVYGSAPEALKLQLDQIFVENQDPIRSGNFNETLRALRKLYLQYHPDKHNNEKQPGFDELQKIIDQLRSPDKGTNKEEILAILDKREVVKPDEPSEHVSKQGLQ